jgi:hypothetical protein
MRTTGDKIRGISNFFKDEIINASDIVNADPNVVKSPLISNSSLRQVCYDCTCHGGPDNKNMELYDLDDIVYNINSLGYRSEEFSKEDAPNNFLYIGCSVTFGVGLPDDVIWPYFLNKKLNGEKIFNLGINGISTNVITYNIHKYIKQFGKPKAIFALYPNIHRTESFLDDKLSIIHFKEHAELEFGPNLKNKVDIAAFAFSQINTIKILADYLESIDIPFFWSSWWGAFDNYVQYQDKDLFKNFVKFDRSIDLDLVEQYKNHHYFNVARDNQHFGILGHISITESFFDAWKEYNEKRNS